MLSIKEQTEKDNASKILSMDYEELFEFLEELDTKQPEEIEACANIDPDWYTPDTYNQNFKNRDCMYVYHETVVSIYDLSQNGPKGLDP